MKKDFSVAISKDRDLQKRDTRKLNRGTHAVISVFEWILMLASAAFSFSFFADLFGFLNLPEGVNIAIAAALTMGQSIAIDRVLNSVVHDVLENRGFNGLSLKTWVNTALVIGMIAFDLFANFQGIPSLARATMKQQAPFEAPAYAGTEEMEDLEADMKAIEARNTYKGNTYIPPADRKKYNALSDQYAKHVQAKTAQLAQAQNDYTSNTQAAQKRMVIAEAFLGWFNVFAYVVMLLIVPAKHLMERENAAQRRATTADTVPSAEELLQAHGYKEYRREDGTVVRQLYERGSEDDPERQQIQPNRRTGAYQKPATIGYQTTHTRHVQQDENPTTRHVQPNFEVNGLVMQGNGFPYTCTWCETPYYAKRQLRRNESPFCCEDHRMQHHAEERKRAAKRAS